MRCVALSTRVFDVLDVGIFILVGFGGTLDVHRCTGRFAKAKTLVVKI